MAGKDFRLTAVLAIRDVASPVVKAFSARWVGLAKVIQSTKFTGLQKQLRLFNRSVMDVAENAKTSAVLSAVLLPRQLDLSALVCNRRSRVSQQQAMDSTR